MMKIPLSRFGITSEEKKMLATRLNPLVNEIFLNNIAKQNNLKYEELEDLDYENNEIFQFDQFVKRREINAKRNKGINKECGTTIYPYKDIEEAKLLDKKSTHTLLVDDYVRGGKESIPTKGYDADDEEEEKCDDEWFNPREYKEDDESLKLERSGIGLLIPKLIRQDSGYPTGLPFPSGSVSITPHIDNIYFGKTEKEEKEECDEKAPKET